MNCDANVPHQIPIDCLNKNFEYLDEFALRSFYLLIKVSVQILLTNTQNYNTLIVCLNESKMFYPRMKLLFQPQLQSLHYLII